MTTETMTISEIHDLLTDRGVSPTDFWAHAMGGDRADLPRSVVERCIASMGRVEAHALVAACGTRLVSDTDGPGLVTDCALSRDVARRLVSDLREAGYEADDAPDGDDPAFAWVYVL